MLGSDALLVAPAALTPNGRAKRAASLLFFAERCGYRVTTLTLEELSAQLEPNAALAIFTTPGDLATGRKVLRTSTVVWLDVCDSRVLLGLTQLRRGRIRAAGTMLKGLWDVRASMRADIVTFISKHDRAWNGGGPQRSYVLHSAYPACPDPVADSLPGRILFVGDLTYPPNRRGLEWFLTRVYRHLPSPKPELRLVGRGASAVPTFDGLVSSEFVPDLTEEYHAAAVAIAPCFGGAGVKTKVVEALLAGVPVVGTREARQGLRMVPGLRVSNSAAQWRRWMSGPAQERPRVAIGEMLGSDDSDALGRMLNEMRHRR